MSLSDPIADMLTRIRNGHAIRKQLVEMSTSKIKTAIAQILKEEGYITDYSVSEGVKAILTITLKYYEGRPVISEIKRSSRPGLRIYKSKDDLPKVLGGLGIAIISTSKGLMTDRRARLESHGGEVLCLVS
ncbi:MAG: 30S ribosomal protein S8 [Candidatus Parabeggiatoa sp. nov. 3]|jgi:small subunit ribosomal protein S8|nr:MAG: 30S ribosomal protein S8 [Gammaproteobacteria bacterium]RKZ69385.1 MAG: 30S ribosomal protein S8 [Gammaproteobacteria bacterium]RKZ90229.1 MAG: 30S ribosomal protein S8 [Gammaproteobacteria bacterium]